MQKILKKPPPTRICVSSARLQNTRSIYKNQDLLYTSGRPQGNESLSLTKVSKRINLTKKYKIYALQNYKLSIPY